MGRHIAWAGGALVIIALGALPDRASLESRPPASRRTAGEARASRLPMIFEENGGRTDVEAQFLARGRGYTAFLTASGPVLSLRVPRVNPDGEDSRANPDGAFAGSDRCPPAFDRAVLRMQLDGAAPDLRLAGEGALAGKVNSFIGSDASKWRTDIATWGGVRGRDAWPGIDVVYRSRGRDLEYSFELKPGADPREIMLAFEGAEDLRVDADGALVVATPGGEVRHGAPVAWQESDGRRDPVAVAFAAEAGGRVAFEVGAFDRGRPLLIDPTLTYSTYLGGTLGDEAASIAVDGSGNACVTGYAFSTDFPTASAYDSSANGTLDVIVAKIGPAGDTLVYGTYLGGSGNDFGFGIALDGSGGACVTGYTQSTDFPTASAFDTSANGSFDAFVAKIGPAGDTLVYGTYLGGASLDWGIGIALDGSGNAYVAGFTDSTDFPTASAYDASANGGRDGFVAKIGPSGDTLVYGTYLGGTATDEGLAIALDGSGNAFVTGRTGSTNFPTASAYDASLNGAEDVFVAMVGPAGDTLVYGTYLGGADFERANGIAVDGSGNAYVTGYTSSTNFPTASAYDASANGSPDAFVAKVGPAGDTLVYGTYLGGADSDYGYAIALDGGGNAFVTGYSASTDFPTASAHDSTANGNLDAVVVKIGPAGDTLVYGTYLGGANTEFGYGIAVDAGGNAYVAGQTYSTDFPTASAYDSSGNGDADAFVARIQFALSTLDVTPTLGYVLDSKTAGKDTAKVWADLAFNGSLDNAISPKTEDVDITFGPDGLEESLHIPAYHAAWRTKGDLRIWQGTSATGARWIVKINKSTLKILAYWTKVDIGAGVPAPAAGTYFDVNLDVAIGNDSGTSTTSFRNKDAGFNATNNNWKLRLP